MKKPYEKPVLRELPTYLVACNHRHSCGKPHRVTYSADGNVEVDSESKTLRVMSPIRATSLAQAITSVGYSVHDVPVPEVDTPYFGEIDVKGSFG